MTASRSRVVARLTIPGMTSVHATRAVFTALGGVEGVVRADVTRSGAVVEHDGSVTEEMLRAAVGVAGFEVAAVRLERGRLPVV
jgi:copper chaperone CopZ